MLGLLSIIFTVTILLILTRLTFGVVPIVYCLFVFVNAKKRSIAAQTKITATLMQGEKIISQAFQHRAYSLLQRRTVLTLTDSRVIVMYRGVFGGFTTKTFPWKNIADVEISENVFSSISGTDIHFHYFLTPDDINAKKSTIGIYGFPSNDAARAYAQAQAEKQAWQEKRRVRTMEQNRASAGGTYISSATSPQASGTISGVATELSKAKQMLDDGVITDVEFQEIKSKLLNRGF